jgi:hypothetical protein
LEVKNQIHSHHYKHERIEGLIIAANANANTNKSTNVRQAATGITTTVDNVMSRYGMEKYSKVTKGGGFTNLLLYELHARGFNDFFKPVVVGANGRPKKRELKGFKDLMAALKALEAARVAQESPNDTDRLEAAKSGFKMLSGKPLEPNLEVTVALLLVSHFGCSIIAANTAF